MQPLLESLLANPEALTERERQIGPTRFVFQKIPALEGFRIIEAIRHQLAGVIDWPSVPAAVGGGGENIAILFRALMSLPPEFTERLRTTLFRHVLYSTPDVSQQPLHGAGDTAFETLEPIHVYEVMLRVLAVNFTDSFQSLLDGVFWANPRVPARSHRKDSPLSCRPDRGGACHLP